MSQFVSTFVTIVFISVSLSFLFHSAKKKEKGMDANNFKISEPKAPAIFLFVFSIITIGAMLALLITQIVDPFVSLFTFIGVELLVGVFLILSVVGLVVGNSNYILVYQDHLMVKKFGRKIFRVDFTQIFCCRRSGYGLPLGELKCYDQYGVPLFSCSNIQAGTELLMQKLFQYNIPPAPPLFPSPAMKQSIPYKKHIEHVFFLSLAIIEAAILYFILCIYMFFLDM